MMVWTNLFVLQLIFLLLISYFLNKDSFLRTKKEWILFALLVLQAPFLLFCLQNNISPWGGPIPSLLGAIAGAGAIHFFFLSPKKNWTFFVYFLPQILLGLHLNNGIFSEQTTAFVSLTVSGFFSIGYFSFMRKEQFLETLSLWISLTLLFFVLGVLYLLCLKLGYVYFFMVLVKTLSVAFGNRVLCRALCKGLDCSAGTAVTIVFLVKRLLS
jgi:hypothetical protein